MALTLADMGALFARRDAEPCSSEPVTRQAQALQCARLAAQVQSSDALVAPALFYDLAHPPVAQGESPALRGNDELPPFYALPFLGGLFGDAVQESIRQGVNVKRCLCAPQADSDTDLSEDSQRSLQLPDGLLDAAQAFSTRPCVADAVPLDWWNEAVKKAYWFMPPPSHFKACAAWGCGPESSLA